MTSDAALPRHVDPRLFRQIMGRFATGVTVVSFLRDGAPAGMTVNAFLAASLEPALVLISVRKASSFVDHVGDGDRFGISILSEPQRNLGPHFAGRRERKVEVRFRDHDGIPLLEGSLAEIIARVVDIHPAGDHLLYIAEIEYLAHGPESQPLIFFSGRYKQIHAHDPIVGWEAVDGW